MRKSRLPIGAGIEHGPPPGQARRPFLRGRLGIAKEPMWHVSHHDIHAWLVLSQLTLLCHWLCPNNQLFISQSPFSENWHSLRYPSPETTHQRP